jgi:hypothetical protein
MIEPYAMDIMLLEHLMTKKDARALMLAVFHSCMAWHGMAADDEYRRGSLEAIPGWHCG